MNIVVDIGNTRTKVGVFDRGVLVEDHYDATPDLLQRLVQHSTDNVLLSAVGKGLEDTQQVLSGKGRITVFDRTLALPLTIRYDTPQTLGLDRIAAAIGATVLFPEKTIVVIDAGSCMTIDLVEKGKIFCGGVISPGVRMRFKAMNAFTNRLPLLTPSAPDNQTYQLPGKSTQECMIAGVLKGIQFELEGHIHHYKRLYPDLTVIMTGGDAQYFENKINTPIFTERSLVLVGLNRVLEYNVK